MSVLVVGLSHKSAPIQLLEKASLDSDGAAKLASRALDAAWVNESAVISTCNRLEVYTEAERFHGAVDEVSALLGEQAGLEREQLARHAYVHYDDAAIEHLFTVASGLDSMIAGEPQILGQVRQSLTSGQAEGTVGSNLNALFQQALRIGKRGHAETDIDRVGSSAVDEALSMAGSIINQPAARFLVLGAGSIARLTVSTLVSAGVDAGRITVGNRTFERASELAERHGLHAIEWDKIDSALADIDVLVCATGANGTVLDADRICSSRNDHRHLTIIDLALPRDVDPAISQVAGTSVVDLEVLAERQEQQRVPGEVERVRTIVGEEVAAFLSAKQASKAAPTVVALRSMATEIVDTELERARTRLPELSDGEFSTLAQTVHRVADKLLHGPTVRVQQLADDRPGLTYADALADLFALDPAAVDAVTKARGDSPRGDSSRGDSQ